MVPWSREFTTMYAHLALGEHIAPAIVVCCLYFTASVLTVLSFLKTKYSWYDVLLISTLCTPPTSPKSCWLTDKQYTGLDLNLFVCLQSGHLLMASEQPTWSTTGEYSSCLESDFDVEHQFPALLSQLWHSCIWLAGQPWAVYFWHS